MSDNDFTLAGAQLTVVDGERGYAPGRTSRFAILSSRPWGAL
jgi:hypothetical protein